MAAGTDRPIVALVSATMAAVPPVEQAFARVFPNARLWNLLDDRLLQDADEQGGVTPDLRDRMVRLIEHARREGADAVLLTCSLYGSVARELGASADLPIAGPDDAAFAAVLVSGAARIGVVGSGELSVADSTERLQAAAASAGLDLEAIPIFAADASAASKAGDTDGVAATVAAVVGASGSPADALLLAQYSLAPAASRIAELTGLPVFSGPDRAALAIRDALRGAS